MGVKASWTLSELGQQVRGALATDYVPAASARVRDVPDPRTIRYYTALGLVDRPAELRGRTALYGPRHLLQLVAIKRLQAEGLSLGQVQERLAGLDDAGLRRIARLPRRGAAPSAAMSPAARHRPPAPTGDSGGTAFWERVPEPAPHPDSELVTSRAPRHCSSLDATRSEHPERDPHLEPLVLAGVPLDCGVTLLVASAARALAPEDACALRRAAEPLLSILRSRGIVHSPKGG